MKAKHNLENRTLKIVFSNLELRYFGEWFRPEYFPGPRNGVVGQKISDQQVTLLAEVRRRCATALVTNPNRGEYSVTLQFPEGVAVYFLVSNRLFDERDPAMGLEVALGSRLYNELDRFVSSLSLPGSCNLLTGEAPTTNLIEG